MFAIDPFTFQWVGLDLTVAIDVCTRSILAFRLTPFSTQGVDLALLLSDLLSPMPMDGRWPADVPYRYCGVPENVVLRAFDLPAGTPLALRPTVRPGTVVIDRGRNYQSVAFMGACEHLRINVQSARPYRGSDKGWIERLFRTMRERLLESLPGYTGPNVLARGKDIEADAVYFTHELEAIIGRWFALDYQRRPHDGLRVPEMPHLTLSPNEAYEEAVARAGFLYVPRDPDLHLRLLPVEARVIGRAGVEVAGLTYDSPVLDPYRRQRCPLPAFGGKWPVRVDRRDLGHVWFQDPRDERFHELSWRHAREVARLFGGSALSYVKRLLVDAGMQRPRRRSPPSWRGCCTSCPTRTCSATIRSVVVLPAPFGPRKPVIVPASSTNDRSVTAITSPKRLVSDSALTTAVTWGPGSGRVERARTRSRAARLRCSRRKRPAALPQDLVVGA